jgi:hypothetical protein
LFNLLQGEGEDEVRAGEVGTVGDLKVISADGLICAAAAGMGTAGLVGTVEGSNGIIPGWRIGLGIAICHFIVPVVLSIAFSELMRKFGWIKPGDQLLELHKDNQNEDEKDKSSSDTAEIDEQDDDKATDAPPTAV